MNRDGHGNDPDFHIALPDQRVWSRQSRRLTEGQSTAAWRIVISVPFTPGGDEFALD